MAKEIPLTMGRVAIVDDEDYERLSIHKWHFQGGKYRLTGYARRVIYDEETGKQKSIYMHQEVLGDRPVDHINGDGLFNVRSNLRKCNHHENMRNMRKKAHNKSGFKGVSFDRKNKLKPWRAQIRDGKTTTIGWFSQKEDAAMAYDKAAKRIYGEFAKINFPEV